MNSDNPSHLRRIGAGTPLSVPDAVCLGVHEDFSSEMQRLRRCAARPLTVQLGPVALHSSACLHLLSGVGMGAPRAAAKQLRPTVVQEEQQGEALLGTWRG